MKTRFLHLPLLLVLLAASAAASELSPYTVFGEALIANLTFIKKKMPKSSISNCSDQSQWASFQVKPEGDYDTVQLTWDATDDNIQGASIDDADFPELGISICWLKEAFTLYFGYGFWNQSAANT